MPDITDFAVNRSAAAEVNVPVHEITGKLVDSEAPHAVLADFTGENALHWPGVLATLTAEQQDQIAEQNALQILNMKAGV